MSEEITIADLNRAYNYFSSFLTHRCGLANVEIAGSAIVLIFENQAYLDSFETTSVTIGDYKFIPVKVVKQ
jgi:hypothetical protein